MTGVTLNEKHCTRDLGLYLTDAVIAAPEVQTSYASVPGGDGYLDLSTALDGEIHYKGREIKLSFRIRDRFCHNFQTSVYSSLRRVPFNARRHIQKELFLMD